MEQNEVVYNNLFTVEERKAIVAQAMADLRKVKGLSQKEVAAAIGVSQATYSAYERGRNEPPIEIIVRLSYLFGCPVDILVQKDRLYRDAGDAVKQAEEIQAQIDQLQAEMLANGGDNETAKAMLELLEKLNGAFSQMASRPDVAASINRPLK